MLRFLLRRLLETLPLLLLLSLFVFLLFRLVPGDYLSEMELNPSVSREMIEELRGLYGIDRPFYTQYFLWLGKVFRGELGYSFAQQRPALDLISERLVRSLLLTLAAFFLTVLVSFPLGIWASLRAGRWPDRVGLVFSLLGFSFPPVLLSLFLVYLAFATGWFPVGGAEEVDAVVLPAVALAWPAAAFWTRTLRAEMLDTLRQPFVVACAARGLSPARIVLHALRNALNPLLSIMGMTLAGFLSGSVVVEKVFDWPGLGALTVDSLLARDVFVALNCVMVTALLTVLASFLADLALALNDPRIRHS